MPRNVAVGVAAVVAGLLVLAAAPLVIMAFMMGGDHMAMMGGRSSDPTDETPVRDVTVVRIEDFAFVPANIVIEAGTTVTWTNYDGTKHTVTSDDGNELDSDLLGKSETFSFTFDTPGEYYYHCNPHPNMRGLITVRAADG